MIKLIKLLSGFWHRNQEKIQTMNQTIVNHCTEIYHYNAAGYDHRITTDESTPHHTNQGI